MAIPKYFRFPFAFSGDKNLIPDAAQMSGAVSYEKGFTVNYQLDPASDASAKNIPRNETNELFFDITSAMKQYQENGFPDFITADMNDGVAYAYSVNCFVRYENSVYFSLVNDNTGLPTDPTKWAKFLYSNAWKPGDVKETHDATLEAGWLWANGASIGNASSNATQRANADTLPLFTTLWNSIPNSALPLQDATGAPVARGVNAAADFNANRRLPVPDRRGRVGAGKDDMGGITAAGRLTVANSGVAGTTLGASGGQEVVALTANNNGPHTHTGVANSAGDHTHGASAATAGDHNHSGNTSTNGEHTHGYGFGDGGGATNAASRGGRFATGVTDNAGNHFHNFTTNNAGQHTHAVTVNNAGAHTHALTIDQQGVGTPHENVQPTIVSNFLIKM